MIHLLWPTARPEIFKNTHKSWIDAAYDKNLIKTLVAVDTDEHKLQLHEYDVIVTYKENPGVAEATYVLTTFVKSSPGDIIILASDDFYAPHHWDQWIINQFNNYSGCLLIQDGYQQGGCVTLPIMDHDCLIKLNRVIYHPSYRHQYSDAELYDNLSQMSMLKNLRGPENPIFEHRHWANGKRQLDSVDDACNNQGYHDSINYNNRSKMSLQERLKA